MRNEAMHIKAVIFHLEGTLIESYKHEATPINTPSPAPDAEAVLGYLRSKNIHLAIFSYDKFEAVKRKLEKSSKIRISDFDTIIGREQLAGARQ